MKTLMHLKIFTQSLTNFLQKIHGKKKWEKNTSFSLFTSFCFEMSIPTLSKTIELIRTSKSLPLIPVRSELYQPQLREAGLEGDCKLFHCVIFFLHRLDHRKSKRILEKHLLLLHWLHQSLWLCRSQQTVENSERDGNTRQLDQPPEKSVHRWRSSG